MADKRSKLAEYFGLEELPPLTMADGVMRGIGRMSDQASEALGPLGAKLDAKLGTVGKPREGSYPQDPLLPAEPPVPQNRRGLFETLGAGVPQIAGFVAGNEVPMAGPVAPRGSVAAFPSPKQSMKAMQDEAILRDMLEAKGARAVEYATPVSIDAQPGPVPGTNPHKLGSPRAYAEDVRQINEQAKALAANEARGGTGSEAFGGLRGLEQNANDWSATGVRGYGPERSHSSMASDIHDLALPPSGPVSAEQTELEKYLAGLYGPKAK